MSIKPAASLTATVFFAIRYSPASWFRPSLTDSRTGLADLTWIKEALRKANEKLDAELERMRQGKQQLEAELARLVKCARSRGVRTDHRFHRSLLKITQVSANLKSNWRHEI